jgi:hypothetical protein
MKEERAGLEAKDSRGCKKERCTVNESRMTRLRRVQRIVHDLSIESRGEGDGRKEGGEKEGREGGLEKQM